MKRIRLFALAAAVYLLFPCLGLYAQQRAEEILKAVVKVRATIPPDARTAQSLGTVREGSGVVIDSQGHVLTIGYLILEAETIEITGADGAPIKAGFVGYDHRTGFGLCRAEKPLDATPMAFGSSAEIREGDPVLVAGYGGQGAVTGARVIARREFAGYWEYLLEEAIFTIPPYDGFAGAALIGRQGQLVGIGSLFTQVRVSEFGTISSNMFVPIDSLKPILSELTRTGRSGLPSRPWIGLQLEESHGRVFILRVTADGPAEAAGLQPEDMILTVKNTQVNGLADFYRKVWALGTAGVDVPLSILRGVRIQDVRIRSADRYEYLKPEGSGRSRLF